jgi:hypothetical protein
MMRGCSTFPTKSDPERQGKPITFRQMRCGRKNKYGYRRSAALNEGHGVKVGMDQWSGYDAPAPMMRKRHWLAVF